MTRTIEAGHGITLRAFFISLTVVVCGGSLSVAAEEIAPARARGMATGQKRLEDTSLPFRH